MSGQGVHRSFKLHSDTEHPRHNAHNSESSFKRSFPHINLRNGVQRAMIYSSSAQRIYIRHRCGDLNPTLRPGPWSHINASHLLDPKESVGSVLLMQTETRESLVAATSHNAIAARFLADWKRWEREDLSAFAWIWTNFIIFSGPLSNPPFSCPFIFRLNEVTWATAKQERTTNPNKKKKKVWRGK